MGKNLDDLIKNHKYTKQICNLIQKYSDQLKYNELTEIDVVREDNIFSEDVKESLENNKNQELNDFKKILLNDFNALEKDIRNNSRKIIMKGFSENIQQQIRNNEVKYFDRNEGEDIEEHTKRMKKQFKALLINDYINNPQNKTSLEMMKDNQNVKRLVYGLVNAQYINILSNSRNEINNLQERGLSKLVNEIHDRYGLHKTEKELEQDSERSFEKVEKNNLKHQEYYSKPSWNNFFFKSAKSLIEKGKEFISGISKYFIM